MRALFLLVTFLFVAVPGGQSAFAQNAQPAAATQTADPEITAKGVIGEVKSIDGSGKQLVVKTDKGSQVTVTLSEKTTYQRLPAGEKSLQNAVKITFADVGEGDRVWARGPVAED